MNAVYKHELIQLTALTLCGVLAGMTSGRYCLSLALVALSYLAKHFYQALRLYALLNQRRRLRAPFPQGLWQEIYRDIAHYQQRSRKRKRNLTRFAARFKKTATTLPDALVILDNQLKVNWANAATQSLLGFTQISATGRPIVELVGSTTILDYLQHGTYDRPLEIIPKHNAAIVLSVRATPFGSKKRQILLIARDITQIHHLNQIRKDFVANVSHELRSPLTVINGYVENMLDTATVPDTLRRPLQRIHAQTSRMTSLVQDLLTLSQLEASEKVVNSNPIAVPELLQHLVVEANSLSTAHRLEVNVDANLWLMGNEDEIRSAWSNLIFNALKHTPPATLISINWYANKIGPVFSVQDTGAGIAAEHIPRLTERFYRVDKSRSRTSGGTGLGLAIVKHVLNQHGAELYISSVVGQGSIFICQFPKNLTVFAESKLDWN